jgi:DNA primase
VDMDEELLNRCIVLTVDEGREQTKAIHERQRRARTLEGMVAKSERGAVLRLHQNAQRLIRRLHVVNPYAAELRFPDHQTRLRRDHMKYLGLIEAVALLHQYQRAEKEVEHRGQKLRYIEVTKADITIANKLAHEVLGRSLDELPPQTRRLLGLVDSLVTTECERLKMARSDFRFSRREVRERTGWGNTQLKIHLGRLIEMEYLVVHRGKQGQGYVYELSYDGQGKDGSLFLCGLQESESGAELTAASRSTSTTSTSRGAEGHFAGGGRPPVGAQSGDGRGSENPEIARENSSIRDREPRQHRAAHPGNGKSSRVVAMPSVVVPARAVS